jgi:hypothetical protein
MTENEQIDEMAEELIDIQRDFNEYCAKPCRECELGGIVNCENHYKAKRLYSKDYRKIERGEWEQYGLRNPKCTLCHGYNTEKSNFCPNCGADMRGEKE